MLLVKDKTEQGGRGQTVRPGMSNQRFLIESSVLHPQLLFSVLCGPEAALDIQRDRSRDRKATLSF